MEQGSHEHSLLSQALSAGGGGSYADLDTVNVQQQALAGIAASASSGAFGTPVTVSGGGMGGEGGGGETSPYDCRLAGNDGMQMYVPDTPATVIGTGTIDCTYQGMTGWIEVSQGTDYWLNISLTWDESSKSTTATVSIGNAAGSASDGNCMASVKIRTTPSVDNSGVLTETAKNLSGTVVITDPFEIRKCLSDKKPITDIWFDDQADGIHCRKVYRNAGEGGVKFVDSSSWDGTEQSKDTIEYAIDYNADVHDTVVKLFQTWVATDMIIDGQKTTLHLTGPMGSSQTPAVRVAGIRNDTSGTLTNPADATDPTENDDKDETHKVGKGVTISSQNLVSSLSGGELSVTGTVKKCLILDNAEDAEDSTATITTPEPEEGGGSGTAEGTDVTVISSYEVNNNILKIKTRTIKVVSAGDEDSSPSELGKLLPTDYVISGEEEATVVTSGEFVNDDSRADDGMLKLTRTKYTGLVYKSKSGADSQTLGNTYEGFIYSISYSEDSGLQYHKCKLKGFVKGQDSGKAVDVFHTVNHSSLLYE